MPNLVHIATKPTDRPAGVYMSEMRRLDKERLFYARQTQLDGPTPNNTQPRGDRRRRGRSSFMVIAG